MPSYKLYPGVDALFNFPPEIRAAFAESLEFTEKLPEIVGTALGQNPTIETAVKTTTANEIAKLDLIESNDVRLPQQAHADGVLVVIVDANNRMTWLAANAVDGGPTDWAMVQIGQKLKATHLTEDVLNNIGARAGAALGISETNAPGLLVAMTDKNGRRTWLEANDVDGGLTKYATDKVAQAIAPQLGGSGFLDSDTYVSNGGEVLPVKTNMKSVSMWASSSGDWGSPYISAPFQNYGATYYNGGKWGERAEHISARLGSRPALISVVGGSIPATGPVDVTSSNMVYSDLLKPYTGTLNGVHGTLSVNADLDKYVFTRTTDGAAVTVPNDTPLIPEIGPQHRSDVVILWMGKNNVGTNPTADQFVIQLTDQAHDWLAPLAKRALVLGHFTDGQTSATHLERLQINAINAAHAKRYGNRFLDIQAYLTGSQVWIDAGITPTQADLDLQAAGHKPNALSQDSGHLNAAGYQAVAKLIDRKIRSLGWYS